MMTNTTYHMLLRVAALTCAVVLAFDSGIVNPATSLLSQETQQYLAASVGMSASITPNGVNQYTADLAAKEAQLAQQEQTLQQRQIAVNLQSGSNTGSNYSTYILSIILFIILVLIILNYVLDFVRAHKQAAPFA